MVKKFTRAFTLYEIMVCILIILILAALMLPSFQSSRKAAKTTVCISNLRQIHSALVLYDSDHGSYPPNSVVWPAFQAYYPKPLSCDFAKGDPEFHYVLLGTSGHRVLPSGKSLSELHEECRTIRGSAIPLAIDMNHIGTDVAPENNLPLLILRENGAVNRVPASQAFYGPKPCTDELTYLNF